MKYHLSAIVVSWMNTTIAVTQTTCYQIYILSYNTAAEQVWRDTDFVKDLIKIPTRANTRLVDSQCHEQCRISYSF